MRTLQLLLMVLAIFCQACAGCSDSAEGDPWQVDELDEIADAGADLPDEPSGCRTDDDCGPGQMCAGPTACDAVWECVPFEITCSAAPPFPACGCDGVVSSFAAGCPGRYAWKTVRLTPPGTYEDEEIRCDPALEFPATFAIRAEFEPLGTADQTMYVRFDTAVPDAEVQRVAADATSIDVLLALEPYTPDGMRAYVDIDGDGLCTASIDREVRSWVHEIIDLDLESPAATFRYRHIELDEEDRCDSW